MRCDNCGDQATGKYYWESTEEWENFCDGCLPPLERAHLRGISLSNCCKTDATHWVNPKNVTQYICTHCGEECSLYEGEAEA
jgi:hypothetical protein